MKRSKRTTQTKPRKKTAPAAPPAPDKGMGRREMLGKLKMAGIGIAVLGGGGLWFTRTVQAEMHEHDLSRIGQGVPTVVQVHDPQCPTCLALQREVRKAMKAFGDGELQYVVASLAKEDGRSLAIDHGVGKVTLLLFDARGNRRDMMGGVIDSVVLEDRFRRHAARKPAS